MIIFYPSVQEYEKVYRGSQLSSSLNLSCHCAQDFIQIVWIFNFVATKETLHTAYEL